MYPHLLHTTSNQLAAYMIALLAELYRQLSCPYAGKLGVPEVDVGHDLLLQEKGSGIRLLGLAV